jgi:hypothetical protein
MEAIPKPRSVHSHPVLLGPSGGQQKSPVHRDTSPAAGDLSNPNRLNTI